MFGRKRSDKDHHLQLEIDTLKQHYSAQEKAANERFSGLKNEIAAAVEQHEKVNAQHNVLGDAVNQIEQRFDQVAKLSEHSTEKSEELYY